MTAVIETAPQPNPQELMLQQQQVDEAQRASQELVAWQRSVMPRPQGTERVVSPIIEGMQNPRSEELAKAAMTIESTTPDSLEQAEATVAVATKVAEGMTQDEKGIFHFEGQPIYTFAARTMAKTAERGLDAWKLLPTQRQAMETVIQTDNPKEVSPRVIGMLGKEFGINPWLPNSVDRLKAEAAKRLNLDTALAEREAAAAEQEKQAELARQEEARRQVEEAHAQAQAAAAPAATETMPASTETTPAETVTHQPTAEATETAQQPTVDPNKLSFDQIQKPESVNYKDWLSMTLTERQGVVKEVEAAVAAQMPDADAKAIRARVRDVFRAAKAQVDKGVDKTLNAGNSGFDKLEKHAVKHAAKKSEKAAAKQAEKERREALAAEAGQTPRVKQTKIRDAFKRGKAARDDIWNNRKGTAASRAADKWATKTQKTMDRYARKEQRHAEKVAHKKERVANRVGSRKERADNWEARRRMAMTLGRTAIEVSGATAALPFRLTAEGARRATEAAKTSKEKVVNGAKTTRAGYYAARSARAYRRSNRQAQAADKFLNKAVK